MNQIWRIGPTFVRFLMVGASGTVVNMGVLWLLVTAGLPHLPAVLISTESSILSNFFLNDLWTFRQSTATERSLSARLWRYQLVSSLTALLTIALFILFSDVAHVYYLLAQFVAIGTATIINFGINMRFTWQLKANAESPVAALD